MESDRKLQFLAERESLEEFFGAEAVLEYEDIPFHQNFIRFDAELENGGVSFGLMPSQAWGELRVRSSPFAITKLMLSDISRVLIRKTKEDHYLVITFNRKATDTLHLWLRPTVMLTWGNCGPDEDETFLSVAKPSV